MHNTHEFILKVTRFYKGGVPSIPAPPPPPKPPAQTQAASNVDAQMAAKRKQQGYASTLLGGYTPGNAMVPISGNNKTLLGM